jgi:tetratricopeptide (TPR) repeat protein
MKSIKVLSVVVLITLAACCLPLEGQVKELEDRLKKDPANPQTLLNLVRYYHNSGGEGGDREAVKKAEKYLERLLSLNPENALAMVYYGSILTMKARLASQPWEAMEYIQKGFTQMEKAVLFDPGDPEIRFVRGANSIRVPDEFGRLSVSLEDFKAIESMDPGKLIDLGKDYLAAYDYYYGLALLKSGSHSEARSKFQKILKEAPRSFYAGKARKELEGMEKRP